MCAWDVRMFWLFLYLKQGLIYFLLEKKWKNQSKKVNLCFVTDSNCFFLLNTILSRQAEYWTHETLMNLHNFSKPVKTGKNRPVQMSQPVLSGTGPVRPVSPDRLQLWSGCFNYERTSSINSFCEWKMMICFFIKNYFSMLFYLFRLFRLQ